MYLRATKVKRPDGRIRVFRKICEIFMAAFLFCAKMGHGMTMAIGHSSACSPAVGGGTNPYWMAMDFMDFSRVASASIDKWR